MQNDVSRKVAYFRALLVESFMKDDAVRYEYACTGLRNLLAKHSPLPTADKEIYIKELNFLRKKGKKYFSGRTIEV